MAYEIDLKRKRVKEKVEQVKETIEEVKKYRNVVMMDLRQLPDALFQTLRKRIREEGGKVLVLRKAVISRVLSTIPKLAQYKNECNKPIALILTNKSPYDMFVFFKENKRKRAAKVGEVVESEIMVPAGDTDLPPGPVLSELKAAGLNVQIKAGKISVIKDSVLAKGGEKLTTQKIKALQSLGIKPFETKAKFIMGYDGEYTYTREILDSAQTVPEDLGFALKQAMNVSLNASYPTAQNIKTLLGSAIKQSINMSLNGNIYSSSTNEQLLISALKQGMALEGLEKK